MTQTRDILHVMQMLGHRNIKNTLVYTQLIDFKDDEYVAKVAGSEKEVVNSLKLGSNMSAITTEARSFGNVSDLYKLI
ncbi:MAG TPA: hypothetical protein VMT42_05330 [candidate division Zixibacteria bacterium]|nr:hypothetical protein [candidate division Zixibacteria bacterium]